ncbi:MAG: hypothetical protein D3903_19390, partial [Candidatus Electrothrix sp. GM3_4]|nr:hypothetical protein [Candidatus Electrothrix sp. GM3_4]
SAEYKKGGTWAGATEELKRDNSRSLPWSIADQASRQEQPVIEGFLNLLELQESRFTAPDVMALLENQVILRRFGLAAEDVVLMRSGILEAGIRWGLDQEQRGEQGLADAHQHTWDFGLDRLLLGYLTGSLDEPWQGIMPCSGTVSSMGSWLGGLTDFIRSLQVLRRRMKARHLPEQWAELLVCLLDDFLAGDGGDNQDGVLILRRTIADFVEHCRLAGFAQKLSLPIIRHWFEMRLSEPAGGQSFLAGRVTFCNMVPMRSVPFKVIWLLGMNDLDYPRTQRTPAFDLISQSPRLGDRIRRDDDRYLFLEALLSARSHLAVSWVGRDQQDNSSLPPSVVVAELRDYINRGWSAEEKEQTPAEMLTVKYPLQPFSRHCFSGDPKTASYASEWLPKPRPSSAGSFSFLQGPLPQPEPCQQVDLGRLVRFWNHPVRFFLEQRMGLRSRYEEEVLPEAEAFFLDHLQKYLLSQEILTTQRSQRTEGTKGKEGEGNWQASPPLYRMQAAGNLPGGRFGHILYHEMERKTAVLVDALEPITQERTDPEEVQLTVDNIFLTGQLSSLYRSGRVTFRPANLKAGDIL